MFVDNIDVGLSMGIIKNKQIEIIDIRNPEQEKKWIEQVKDPSERIVGNTNIHGVVVSTVFLGMSSYGGYWFETMIFNSEVRDLQDYQVRYRTWEQAEKGHKMAVDLVNNTPEV